jgi:hypothetical protein
MAVTISTEEKAAGAGIIEGEDLGTGKYRKFADGTLMCWYTASAVTSISTDRGAGYGAGAARYYIAVTMQFPYSMSEVDTVCDAGVRGAITGCIFHSVTDTTDHSVTIEYFADSAGSTIYPGFFAIGKWE